MAGLSAIAPIVEKVGLAVLLEPQSSGVIFRAACSTVGVIYPAYQSFKTVEDKIDLTRNEQWLTYWVIYGMLSLAEGTTEEILSKVPYYYHAKFALLVWLQLPKTQGAQVLYQRYLRPNLLRFQPKIDLCLDKVGSGLAMLYSIYKVPLDSTAAAIGFGFAQLTAFFKWFMDESNSSGKANGTTKASPTSQFIAK